MLVFGHFWKFQVIGLLEAGLRGRRGGVGGAGRAAAAVAAAQWGSSARGARVGRVQWLMACTAQSAGDGPGFDEWDLDLHATLCPACTAPNLQAAAAPNCCFQLQEMGLAFDEWDLDYYTTMFRDELKRDPTNVELFDIAQSNSEHSR